MKENKNSFYYKTRLQVNILGCCNEVNDEIIVDILTNIAAITINHDIITHTKSGSTVARAGSRSSGVGRWQADRRAKHTMYNVKFTPPTY